MIPIPCCVCQELIAGKFGFFSPVNREGGKLVLPGYTGSNAHHVTVCDGCWTKLPSEERLIGLEAIRLLESDSPPPVYVYQASDGGQDGVIKFMGEIALSKADPKTLQFVRLDAAKAHLQRALAFLEAIIALPSREERRAAARRPS